MKMRTLISLLLVGFPWMALASGGGEHGAVEFDDHLKQVILFQAINVGAVIIGLVYFLRKPVQQYFADRRAHYFADASKAQSAREAAEHEFKEIQNRLQKLVATTDESLARAQAESADLRKSLIAEAHQAAEKVKEEAKTTAHFEIQRALADVRAEMIQEAVAATLKQMSTHVSQEDHQRLNKEFIRNIEGVQP